MDLKTTYLGLSLKHPVIASAGPIAQDLDGIRRLEDSNAAAIVLPSLFEEQCQRVDKKALSAQDLRIELLRRASDAVDLPIIGSLNGTTEFGWRTHAKAMEEAGAAALELNVYYLPTDLNTSGSVVEERYVTLLRAVKDTVTIPVAMKLSPYFTAFAAMAKRLVDEGADGLALFNRFYQPDIELSTLHVSPILELSQPHEARLPMMWIGVLSGRIQGSIAATTGVQRAEEVIKYLLVGADAVMTTSSLLRNGPSHMADLVRGLAQWMHDRDYERIDQIRGALSQARVDNPGAFVRTNYVEVLEGYGTTEN